MQSFKAALRRKDADARFFFVPKSLPAESRHWCFLRLKPGTEPLRSGP